MMFLKFRFPRVAVGLKPASDKKDNKQGSGGGMMTKGRFRRSQSKKNKESSSSSLVSPSIGETLTMTTSVDSEDTSAPPSEIEDVVE